MWRDIHSILLDLFFLLFCTIDSQDNNPPLKSMDISSLLKLVWVLVKSFVVFALRQQLWFRRPSPFTPSFSNQSLISASLCLFNFVVSFSESLSTCLKKKRKEKKRINCSNFNPEVGKCASGCLVQFYPIMLCKWCVLVTSAPHVLDYFPLLIHSSKQPGWRHHWDPQGEATSL